MTLKIKAPEERHISLLRSLIKSWLNYSINISSLWDFVNKKRDIVQCLFFYYNSWNKHIFQCLVFLFFNH